jgi:hypothetical protein
MTPTSLPETGRVYGDGWIVRGSASRIAGHEDVAIILADGESSASYDPVGDLARSALAFTCVRVDCDR